ncbi:hypothetical protein BCR37DRAFT_390135 [Protomyces lactucae-debilis]|uniref:Cytochrome c oxidase-assembly factor COX23, mitochondrial n=1 Tax=Protomyces lactucae-debilis TaxID=2754530 RepID=A0A1Y2FU93_PROLT|nr:uncharacterized protein BCR37DRAFT_390135 [Protomyces lactucae-debilis]ORY87591.1 hypothetical protein BCR37DRAFT_390135 [Protomyces lactucae-debilis]
MSYPVKEFAGPDPTSADIKKTFKSKSTSKYFDPCEESSRASLKCLDKNAYDREACSDFFRAYRECKARWMEERRKDRKLGIL